MDLQNNDSATNNAPANLGGDNSSYGDIITKDIFELLGVENMPEQQKRNLYTKMLETIQNRVIIKITKELPQEALAEWEHVAKSNNQAEMAQFFDAHSINVDEMLLKETLMYKMEIVELTKPIRDANKKKADNTQIQNSNF